MKLIFFALRIKMHEEVNVFLAQTVHLCVLLVEIGDSEQRCAHGIENKLWQARTDERIAEEADVWVPQSVWMFTGILLYICAISEY